MRRGILRDKSIAKTTGILLVIVAAICILVFFMRGEITVHGEYPGSESSAALKCSMENVVYPFFNYDESIKKTIDVNALFRDGKINSVSIVYTLVYDEERKAIGSESINHGAMNKSFGAKLGPDALSANYSVVENSFKTSFYAAGGDINLDTKKYFMIDDLNGDIRVYKDNYEKQGFTCIEKNS